MYRGGRRCGYVRRSSNCECVNEYNEFIVQGLLNIQSELRQQNSSSNLQHVYQRAIGSIKKCPLPLNNVEDLRKLKFVGDVVVSVVKKIWQESDMLVPAPGSPTKSSQQQHEQQKQQRESGAEIEKARTKDKKKRGPSNKIYVPQFRSGAFGVLVAFAMKCREEEDFDGVLRKSELIRLAQQHCDTSYSFAEGSHYSAWSSAKTLINKGLLACEGSPKVYFLTEEGMQLANDIVVKFVDRIDMRRDQDVIRPAIANNAKAQVRLPLNPGAGNILRERFKNRDRSHIETDPRLYDVILLIDNREKMPGDPNVITKRMSELGVRAETMPLSIGDMWWVARRKDSADVGVEGAVVLSPIVERKKVSDLASSLQDGRYGEQKFRMKNANVESRLYLVEGNLSEDMVMPRDALRTAIAESESWDKFVVHRTSDFNATLNFLAAMTHRLAKDFAQGTGFPGNPILVEQFIEETSKTQELDRRTRFAQQLTAIRGVSEQKADAVSQSYETARHLWQAYEQCSSDAEASNMLASHEFLSKGVVPKKIGPAVSKRIHRFFRDAGYKSEVHASRSFSANAERLVGQNKEATHPAPCRSLSHSC